MQWAVVGVWRKCWTSKQRSTTALHVRGYLTCSCLSMVPETRWTASELRECLTSGLTLAGRVASVLWDSRLETLPKSSLFSSRASSFWVIRGPLGWRSSGWPLHAPTTSTQSSLLPRVNQTLVEIVCSPQLLVCAIDKLTASLQACESRCLESLDSRYNFSSNVTRFPRTYIYLPRGGLSTRFLDMSSHISACPFCE